jgi:type I site-specific restriction endonuclease
LTRSSGPDDIHKTCGAFSHDFFDLIMIDEFQRGSAADDAA